MKTVYINLFGGPGAGKSTLAAGLFHVMKRAHEDCELVTEYPKELAWDGRTEELSCQFKVTGEQMWRHQRLNGKVKYVITDSPVLLGCIYGRSRLSQFQISAIYEWFLELDNYNVFLDRSETVPYNPNGRVHSYTEAVESDKLIRNYLNDMEVLYETYSADVNPKDIYKAIKAKEGKVNTLPKRDCLIHDGLVAKPKGNEDGPVCSSDGPTKDGGGTDGVPRIYLEHDVKTLTERQFRDASVEYVKFVAP